MTFWLSRNEKGLVIGRENRELIQFLVDDKTIADCVLKALNQYVCGVCGTTDPLKYQRCNHPMCPDGRDR